MHSGKFINVAGASRDNGADVLVRGRTSQFITCLTLVHTSLDLGAKIHQWNNPDQPETQWRIRLVPSSQFDPPGATYAIQNNKARGKFLNVHGASYDNGAKLVVRVKC